MLYNKAPKVVSINHDKDNEKMVVKLFQVNSMASLDWKTHEREWNVQIYLNIDCYYEIGKHLNLV